MSGPFSLKIDASPIITYVNWQAESLLKEENASKTNAFSFFRSVMINNESDEDVHDCSLSFSISPAKLSIADVPLALIEKRRETLIRNFRVQLDSEFLYKLTESVPGTIVVRLLSKEGEILSSEEIAIRFLPIGESASRERNDEVLASFVTPNDPLVGEMLKDASNILLEKTGDPSFQGYQLHDPDSVVSQLDAIYCALRRSGISYVTPPASFEKTFQRIRLPREVLTQKMGTCIDLAILFSSLVEAVGLSPVLLVYKKHCNLGVWLDDEHELNAAKWLNGQLLFNAASKGYGYFLFIEATDFVLGSGYNFLEATEQAYLRMQNGSDFEYALDIKRCRNERILPIPSPKKDDEGNLTFTFPTLKNHAYELPSVDVSQRRYLDEDANKPRDRFSLWEDKLLDLNLKNPLISFKFNMRTIQVPSSNPEKRLDALYTKEKMQLFSETYAPLGDAFAKGPIAFPESEFAEYEQNNLRRNLLACYSVSNLGDDLFKNIARKGASAIEESGCNPLFLTIGFIRWYESDLIAKKGGKPNYAPLLLLPLSMKPRKSGSYYSISYDIDELQLNRTFIEYLRRFFKIDFSSLNVLPLDGNGHLDIRVLFNEVRRLIEGQLNWSLIESASTISLFSFAHFAMWKDLKDHEGAMKAHPIVKALTSGEKDETFVPLEISAKDIEQNLDPSEMAVPLPADSSQMETIYAAMKGESFILDGPPGTGKSQTIANIIANSLYHGKKVLFVAEKEVALDVVKKRLDALRLGDCVLKIPSVSTPKSEVLSVIWNLLDKGPIKRDERFSSSSESVKTARAYLNEVIDGLHQPNGYFISLYQAIVGYLEKEKSLEEFRFDDAYLHALTEESFDKAKRKLSDLSSFSMSFGGYGQSPFRIFRKEEYTLSYREEAREALRSLKPLVHDLHVLSGRLLNKTRSLKESRHNAKTYLELVSLLGEETPVWREHLGDEAFEGNAESLRAYLALRLDIAKEKEFIFASFAPEVDYLDPFALLASYKSLPSLSFFKRFKARRQIIHDLKTFAHDKSSLKDPLLGRLLETMVSKRKHEEELIRFSAYARSTLGKLDYSSSIECKRRLDEYEATLKANALLRRFDASEENKGKIALHFAHLGEAAIHHKDNETLRLKLSSFDTQSEDLKARLSIDLFAIGDGENFFARLENAIGAILEQMGRLSEYTSLLVLYDAASKFVPGPFMEAYHQGKIDDATLLSTYLATTYFGIIQGCLNQSEIASITSEYLKIKIDEYRHAMSDFQTYSQLEIFSRVSSRYPKNAKEYAVSSRPYQLQKIAKNGGRGISLRNVLSEYSDIILNLTPCFLMSPMAVSQYLDFGTFKFDLVIFDEASQIPTHEAIGSISRAETLVVAGDEKQMPPSSFFKTNMESDESGALSSFEAASGDLESLLDDAITLGLPRHRLNWHYRSQYESLIAFSNSYFYDHSLWTFPSAQSDAESVSFHKVNGVYKRGEGTNPEEARAIVKEIIRRRKSPELSNRSVGVVTFNIAQQALIERLLDEALPDEDLHLGGETLFVKNLENVQGDERDVILFSVTYGPDEKGRVYKNFGPLSQKGGERRLNVAVSRARKEMIVFSSMEPSDIDANTAKNEGASYLRDFLRFAKGGVGTLPLIYGGVYQGEELSVGHFLADDLRKKGYRVEENVGASNFKVDVAVVDEKQEGSYRLGIIFDNPRQAEMTCQDRNINEPSLLKKRRWRTISFLSSEYFDHKEELVRRIERALTDENEGKDEEYSVPSLSFVPTANQSLPHKIPYARVKPRLMVLKTRNDAVSFLQDVVNVEGPVSERILKERYKDAFGIGRLGSVETKHFNFFLSEVDCLLKLTSDQPIYYPSDLDPDKYVTFRSREGDPSSTLFDIGFREIGNCAYDLLKEQGSLSLDDLYRLLLKEFGFVALNERARTYLSKAIRWNVLSRCLFYVDEDKRVSLR